jgi:FkbM family methyltransferase
MEGLTAAATPTLNYLGEVAADVPFMLVDVGCSGGIDQGFRRFGARLRAIGIDPNVAEVRRLAMSETHQGISYIAAFASLPEGHPLLAMTQGRSHWGRSPWNRLSVAKSMAALRTQSLSGDERTKANLWSTTTLVDQARTVVLPDYLREQGVASVDFVKIDVDGKDLEILHSFDTALFDLGVLGVGLEVNFFGTDAPADHTFHNSDRFMKARGFELVNLTVRHYSMAALPTRYLYSVPAQGVSGRILQGDALYVRDLASPEFEALGRDLGAGKLLNLIGLFAAFGLPDCAAEIVLRFDDLLSPHCSTEVVLDLLAAQAQGDRTPPLSYRELMQRFEHGDRMFFSS